MMNTTKKKAKTARQTQSKSSQELVKTFVEKIKKKKVYDILCAFVESPDSFSDLDVAAEISSFLTHSFLAVIEDERYFNALNVAGQIDLLNKYVNGFLTKEETRAFYGELFNDSMDSSD